MVRVRVHVDGFNLYYGALKPNPAARWLDLVALSRRLRPGDSIEAVRYFTARVNGSQDPASPGRQKLYLAALGTSPGVSVHLGRFRTHPVFMPLVAPAPGGPVTVQVHKTEEKGSDVNLATHLLLDGLDGLYDEALVISDDSDLIEPIHHANERFGPVHVISPRGPIQTPGGPQLPFGMAKAGASWTQLRVADLLAAQFPSPLTLVSGRTVHRPPGWR